MASEIEGVAFCGHCGGFIAPGDQVTEAKCGLIHPECVRRPWWLRLWLWVQGMVRR